MSARRRVRAGWLAAPSRAFVVGLVALRVVVLAVVLLGASRGPVTDPEILRAERVASSPAAVYRGFPSESMPLETLLVQVLGGSGAAATAIRVALVAFVADLAVAAALGWGWGWRPMAVYLLLGLPLLGFVYQRFDLVSVALTAWGFALVRDRRDEGGGLLLGLAVMTKLWPAALLVPLWLARRWRGLASAGAAIGVFGLLWYAWGGPKAPLQVLTFRDAIGWSVDSVVGSLLWVFTGGPIAPEGEAVTIGVASTGARAILLVAMLAVLAAIWFRTSTHRDRDPSGGASLAAVIALVVFAPRFSLAYTAWLLPWAAIAFEGGRRDHVAAALAAIAISLTGLVAVLTDAGANVPGEAAMVLLVVRNAILVAGLAWWLLPAAAIREQQLEAANT